MKSQVVGRGPAEEAESLAQELRRVHVRFAPATI